MVMFEIFSWIGNQLDSFFAWIVNRPFWEIICYIAAIIVIGWIIEKVSRRRYYD